MAEQNLTELYLKTLEKLSNLTVLQKKVLRASLKLFACQGFEATTTAQIAQEAGVSTGSVYKQFPNKDALLTAVLAPLFHGVLDKTIEEFVEMGLSPETLTLEAFVTLFVADRLRFISDNLEMMELVTEQMLTNPDFLNRIQQFLGKQLDDFVIPQIDELMTRGEMLNIPHDVVLQLILGTIHGYFGKVHMGLTTRSIEEDIQLTSKLIINALRAN